MNKQKGHVLLMVLLIAAVVGGYFIYQKQVKPAPVQQTVQPKPSPKDASPAPTGAGETANWKTYTKDNLWEIKYPQNLHKMKDNDARLIAFADGDSASYPLTGASTHLQIAWDKSGDSYNDLFRKEVGTVYKNLSIQNTVLKKLIIGGYPAVMQLEEIVPSGHSSGENSNGKELNVYIKSPLDVRITLASLQPLSLNEFTEKYLPVFDQILSTFKFLDQK